MTEREPDPAELPEDPEQTAADAAGEDESASEQGRRPAPDELDRDPAHDPDGPVRRYKGG